jgi:ribosomal protein L34E
VPPRAAAPKADRCPRCDASFGCGIATGSCWCAEVALTDEDRGRLAGAYDGCLCPACLRELARAS